MKIDPEKTAHNAKSSEDMHRFLQNKTWEEKVASIERMREATRSAREAMRRSELAEQADKVKED